MENRKTADAVEPIAESSAAPKRTTVLNKASVIVGLVMLVIGVLVGYLGRPLVTPPPAVVTIPPSASKPTTLIDLLATQVRHFKGNPNAPVTILEFSDFQ